MREIGGYIELDKYNLPLLHEGAVALNCGRNALAYLIKAKKIKKIFIPSFLCSSVKDTCEKEGIEVEQYSVKFDFTPVDNIILNENEWLYIVNYYGQINNEKIAYFKNKYDRIIVDNAQAYFQMPVRSVDTLYTCRKFFGVPDGAFLYTDTCLDEDIQIDESFDRMRFLLGRFERSASEFYADYSENNHKFTNEPIKYMSKLTDNLLRGLDYERIKNIRTENFKTLHNAFKNINQLQLSIPDGAFVYPLYLENGAEIRKILQGKRIFIPTLWPDVFKYCNELDLEYDMANNILPIPVDQRYSNDDMSVIIKCIFNCFDI